MISHEELLRVVHYNPETGIWTSKIELSARRPAGVRVDSKYGLGYRAVFLFGIIYPAHTLAWFYMTGDRVPEVDHKNCQPADNRWSNLRPANQSQNGANTKLSSANTSGVKGIYWDTTRGRWCAQIKVNYRRIFLGRYTDIEEARAARQAAAEKYFGEFARHA